MKVPTGVMIEYYDPEYTRGSAINWPLVWEYQRLRMLGLGRELAEKLAIANIERVTRGKDKPNDV